MKDAPSLLVPQVAAQYPLVLCGDGFLSTLTSVEEQITALVVSDAATAQQAADLQSRLTKAAKTLDDQRKALNKPFDDQITAINAAAKGPAGRIQQAKDRVSKALTAFAVAEQQRVAEENRKRQAELQALQEQQRKEKELQTKAALDIADDWDADPAPVAAVVPTETERKIAAVAVPVVAAARPSGVTIRVTLDAIVEDIEKIPSMFIERSVKLRAIQSTYCVKYVEGQPLPVCPGVKFEIKRTTVATGR